MEGKERGPKQKERSRDVNAGRPTGGDTHGRGPRIVVREGNAVHKAKGQPRKVGQSAALIQEHRGGIVQFHKSEVCAMQGGSVYLELVHERGKKGLPLERVYRQLFNRNLYLKAYGKIYRNAGALTPGVNEDTVDAMSLEKMDAIIEALRYERYQWKPARRVSIPKKDGKKRPLGLPICLSYCLSFQAMFGIPMVANWVDQKPQPTLLVLLYHVLSWLSSPTTFPVPSWCLAQLLA